MLDENRSIYYKIYRVAIVIIAIIATARWAYLFYNSDNLTAILYAIGGYLFLFPMIQLAYGRGIKDVRLFVLHKSDTLISIISCAILYWARMYPDPQS